MFCVGPGYRSDRGPSLLAQRMKGNVNIDKKGVWQTGLEVKRAALIALRGCCAHFHLIWLCPPEEAGGLWEGGGWDADRMTCVPAGTMQLCCGLPLAWPRERTGEGEFSCLSCREKETFEVSDRTAHLILWVAPAGQQPRGGTAKETVKAGSDRAKVVAAGQVPRGVLLEGHLARGLVMVGRAEEGSSPWSCPKAGRAAWLLCGGKPFPMHRSSLGTPENARKKEEEGLMPSVWQ